MAKEVIPNNPIPVGLVDESISDDNYCASFLNYADNSFSKITKELLKYLENAYDNIGYGGNTRSFIAKDTNISEVKSMIINANIYGINKLSIDNHLILNQNDSDVMIFVNLY